MEESEDPGALTTLDPVVGRYDLVILGGSAGGLSVAVSGLRAGLGKVRVVEPGHDLAFRTILHDNDLDIGFGENVVSIDMDGTDVIVTTTKRTYRTRACVVAVRPPAAGWSPDADVLIDARVHVDDLSSVGREEDVLVVGTTDHAVELMSAAAYLGSHVVLASRGLDPALLSPAGDHVLRRLERERRVTVLYRHTPTAIVEVGGFPMAYFDDRRTPDLQFDHVVFASPRQTATATEIGLSTEAGGSGQVWLLGEPTGGEAAPTAPGWRLWKEIAAACFPELQVAVSDVAARRRRHTGERLELQREFYNATISSFERTHSDLWRLRVQPDDGDASFVAGQYATLGLGYWEDRIDGASDDDLEGKWEKLIRRAYSISSRIVDSDGYLTDESGSDELEFYVVLVKPEPGNIPALTPRLALKQSGDRIYLGPKVAGRYTLAPVDGPESTVVLLSTGTGEAPHNAMIGELLRRGHSGPIVSVVGVARWQDLGYLETHTSLAHRFHNYHYLPVPTREAHVDKRYIQDVLIEAGIESTFGVELDPGCAHVFLCGNPAMIGLPDEDGTFPAATGAVEILVGKGFQLNRRGSPGNVHYEEYW